MKKNFLKMGVTTILLVAAGCTSAMAAQGTETVQIQYNDISLVVDGVPITPEDANGSEIEPFIYNGTTYLPIRAVGDAIGKQVTWDGATKTVYIGEAPNATVYLTDVCPPYDSNGYYSDRTFEMDGKKYNAGSFYFYSSNGEALYNLDGKYSALDVLVGHEDNFDDEKLINIYLDGILSQTIELEPEQLAQNVHIPLNNALQMKIEVAEGKYIGFANAVLS